MQEVGITGDVEPIGMSLPAGRRRRQPAAQFELTSIWDFEFESADVIAVAFDIGSIPDWCGNVIMNIETVDDRDGDVGHRAWAHTKGWLPHSFVFSGTVTRRVPDRLMEIEISGDFSGLAGIEVMTIDGGTRVMFTWKIDCRHRLIAPIARMAPQLFVWNHRWAMRRSFNAMQRELVRRRNGQGDPHSARPTFPQNIALLRNYVSNRRQAFKG